MIEKGISYHYEVWWQLEESTHAIPNTLFIPKTCGKFTAVYRSNPLLYIHCIWMF